MTKKLKISTLLAVAGIVWASQACAFSDDEARRAILDLRAQVSKMQEQIDVQQKAQMVLMTKISDLQAQNRRLTGGIEELNNTVHEEKRSTRQLFGNLEERLVKIEPVSMEIDGVPVLVKPEAKREFDAAMEKLQAAAYSDAAAAFKDFAADWTKSPLRQDALYWQGVSNFAAGRYKSVIRIQDQMIREYPKSSRVPDAMLSVASAQAAAGNLKAARKTYQRVMSRYPKSAAAKEARSQLQALK